MYKQDAPERYEQLIAFLSTNLPAPVDRQEEVDGSIRFTGGDPPEVVVHLTQSSVIVAEFAGEWESPLTFAARPRRVGLVKWRRLSENALFTCLAVAGQRRARSAARVVSDLPVLRTAHRARMAP